MGTTRNYYPKIKCGKDFETKRLQFCGHAGGIHVWTTRRNSQKLRDSPAKMMKRWENDTEIIWHRRAKSPIWANVRNFGISRDTKQLTWDMTWQFCRRSWARGQTKHGGFAGFNADISGRNCEQSSHKKNINLNGWTWFFPATMVTWPSCIGSKTWPSNESSI